MREGMKEGIVIFDESSSDLAKPMKYEKVKSEMSKLQTWLRKHQDESVADGRYD